MRVYLPASVRLLSELAERGVIGPAPITGFALTPALRQAYSYDDEEELEYVAFSQAARASLRLLDAELGSVKRRVVVSVDVTDGVSEHPELDDAVVRIADAVPAAAVACFHIDGDDAVDDVTAAAASVVADDLGSDDAAFAVGGAEGHELEWYDASELEDLIRQHT